MKILPATLSDIPSLETLIQSCYRGDSSRKGWTHEADLVEGRRTSQEFLKDDLTKPGVTFLKCEDKEGKLIGCVYTEVEHDKLYIGMLCVQPDFQGGGLGKKLLAAADEMGKEKGCSGAKMQVLSQRKELIEFYERRGYRRSGETVPFPKGEDFGKPKMPLEFIVIQKDY